MPKPVSKAELARLDGRHKSQVTRACQPGGALEYALMPDGRIDLSHSACRAWRALRDDGATSDGEPEADQPTEPTKPRPKPRKGHRTHDPSQAPHVKDDGSVDELADWTLGEIVECFGTLQAYRDILDSRVKIEHARRKDIDNDRLRGLLIEREFVQTHVFGLVDSIARRILRDSPKTIALLVYSAARREADIEESERLVRENLSSQLRDVQSEARRLLGDE